MQLKGALGKKAEQFGIFVRFADLTEDEKKMVKGEKGDTPPIAEVVELLKQHIPPPLDPLPAIQPPSVQEIVKEVMPLIKQKNPPKLATIVAEALKHIPQIDQEELTKKIVSIIKEDPTLRSDLTIEELEARLSSNDKALWDRVKELVARAAQGQMRQTGGGTFIHVGPTPPDSPKLNQLWVDTS